MLCSSEYSDSEHSSSDDSVYIGTDSDLSASDTERSSAETFVFAALTSFQRCCGGIWCLGWWYLGV